MLLWLTHYLDQFYSPLSVFYFLTLRAILAVLTALLISLILGPMLIRLLKVRQLGQVIRSCNPQGHKNKAGTPTMGGLLIIFAVLATTLLWADLTNHYVWIAILTLSYFGGIGFIDDWLKISKKNHQGLSAKQKFFWQSFGALSIASILYATASGQAELELIIPLFKEVAIPLGLVYIVLGYFVIVGTSNAVNITDGLDGLAIMPTILIAGALGVFVYTSGHSEIAAYLQIPFIKGSGEMVVFTSAILGSGLGFLWFNTYPAQVFMGDVGSLALGAALGLIALIVRQEIVFFIMSGIFVAETCSVILQVTSYKLHKKRLFKMAPIHHHFELKGMAEPKIIVRFWIITVMLVAIGLSTLKLR